MSFFFSAGLRGAGIPDSDIFQSPLYRFAYWEASASDGDTGFDLPEVEAGLTDATAVGGPTFRDDQNGTQAGEYDGADDGHDYTADSDVPTGDAPHSQIALVYDRQTNTDDQHLVSSMGETGTGTQSNIRHANGDLEYQNSGTATAQWTDHPKNEWITVGVTYDGDGGMTIYGNGSQRDTGSGSFDLADTYHAIGYEPDQERRYWDGYIGDVIISDVEESESAISEYHDAWMDLLS